MIGKEVAVEMPDDGAGDAVEERSASKPAARRRPKSAPEPEPRDDSPLASEPAPRAKKRPAPARARTVNVNVGGQPVEPEADPPAFEDESPLAAEAEAQSYKCEVDRIGPGEGPGWVGRQYDYGDGNGPQDVDYGRAGTFPRTEGLFERVQAQVGGGQFEFKTKGLKPVTKILPGPPLPLPGSSIRPTPPRGGSRRADPLDEIEDMIEDGLYPADSNGSPITPRSRRSSDIPDGWLWLPAHNVYGYFVDGVRTQPPRGSRPPAPPGGGYSHGSREDRQEFSLADLMQMQREEARERREQEREDRKDEADRRREEAREERERRAEERAAEQRREDKKREEERDREDKKREEERERRAEERKREERAEQRAAEDRKEAARLAADATKAQAEAQKESARLQAEATKEAARFQSEQNKLLFQVLTQSAGKQDGATALREGISLGAELAGGKTSEVAEVAGAIERAAPAVVGAVRDGVLAWRGYPVQGQNGALNGLPAQQPPGLPGPGAEQAQGGGGLPDAREVAGNLQMVAYFASLIEIGATPSTRDILNGAAAYGLTARFDEIRGTIAVATPEVIADQYERGARMVGDPFASNVAYVQKLVLSEGGRRYLTGLQAMIREQDRKVREAERAKAEAEKKPAAPASAPAPKKEDEKS